MNTEIPQQPQRPPATEAAQVPLMASGGKTRILLVDDEAPIRKLERKVLESPQREFVEAANGRDGLEAFRAGKFDLVITDNTMPIMHGTQMIAEIRKIKPDQKIIMITGDAYMTAEKMAATGADIVLTKPPSMVQLRNSVDSLTKLTN
ncbi:MAG: response regulator [Candidatus Altiarchaeota archaeon]|nr:response regulator [Candidatus Altiarchaeota archaeon]